MLALKTYQQNALKVLDAFLRQARLTKPKPAFEMQVGQGIPYRTDPFGDTPCVCLRLPTGGGKTLLASHAIVHIARAWLATDAPVALWLTPSDTIRSQTLSALQTPGHPYREALEATYGLGLRVCDLDQATTIQPHDLGRSAIVIVATIQSFRIEETALRNVYAFNEAFEPHFKNVPPHRLEGLEKVAEADLGRHQYLTKADLRRVKYSLANLLALHEPIVIVDEAHNARTELSFRALKNVQPSCILELTATPTPKESNVLFHVSAQELQAEDMIKLPIVLAEHTTGWESAVFDAIQRRKALEVEAQKDTDYIRPIVLFQAQPKGEPATVDVLRQHLVEQQHIPAEQIAIATGAQRELDDIDLSAPACPIRYVVTVEALKEGWDCPFAYVLCSLQSVKSAKDVEQLLGRVLRMPYARRRAQPALNRAYAYVVARDFAEAANALADRMIEKMGFEALEVASMMAPADDLFGGAGGEAKPKPPVLPEFALDLSSMPALPAAAQATVTPNPEGGAKVAIKGAVTSEIEEALLAVAKNTKERNAIQQQVERHNAIVAAVLAPSMRGVPFIALPRLCYREQGVLELIERETLAALANVDLLAAKVALPGFNVVESANTFEIYIENQKVKLAQAEGGQLALNEVPTAQTEIDMVRWLDPIVRQPDIQQAQMLKYLGLLIHHLTQERRISLAGLIRSRFVLAREIEKRIEELRSAAVSKGFRQLVLEGAAGIEASLAFKFEFTPQRYPARPPFYRGKFQFKRHYYPVIADLKADGEEFDCAVAIDTHQKVKHWVRNLVGLPEFAFWLPTSSDYFYPDFVCELADGKLLVVEYKGEQLRGTPDTIEKDQVGKLWAKQSGGKCLFLMAYKKDDVGRDVRGQLNAAIG